MDLKMSKVLWRSETIIYCPCHKNTTRKYELLPRNKSQKKEILLCDLHEH